MRRLALRSLHILLPMALLAGALTLRFEEPPLVQRFQLIVFDVFNRLHPRAYVPDSGVRIVDIDDDSLQRLGQWPWPRTRVAEMVYRLRQQGAAVVAFDIVFAEPDRTSPQNIVDLWPAVPEFADLRERVRQMPDHDVSLAQFIEGLGGVVTGFALTYGEAPRVPVQKGNFAFGGDDPRSFVQAFTGAVANIAALEHAAAGNGNFNMVPEGDGVIRRVPLVVGFVERDRGGNRGQSDAAADVPVRVGAGPGVARAAEVAEAGLYAGANDLLYPSLALEALRVVQGAKTNVIKSSGASGELSFGVRTGIVAIKSGAVEIPTDRFGRMWVHYTGHRPERYVPAWQVLAGGVDPALIDGHVVLVGTSAAGLQDLRATPLDLALPGVEIHAELLEQILQQAFMIRPDWAKGAEMAYILAIGLFLIALLPRLGALWCAAIGATTVAAVVGGSWYAYTGERLLLDPIYPALSTLGVYLSASLISYVRSEADRRQVRTQFQQYLSPALVEQLATQPERLKLGGETKNMTILFCDVRGFTTISETFKSNPHGLTVLINRLLTPLTDVILRSGGTIDKYMGDCIMAFWNAPLDDDDHAVHACGAALEMYVALAGVNAARGREAEAAGEAFLPLNIGIGLNTGVVVVGNMGSEQRFDYSVLGDAVNLAARLEGQSKTYGVDTVIGPETARAAAGRYAVLELDLIAVKGKTEAVDIYSLLGDAARAAAPDFQAWKTVHEAMLKAVRAQQWDRAEELIGECRALSGGEIPGFYALYEERVASYRAYPPPADWDGVFVATSK